MNVFRNRNLLLCMTTTICMLWCIFKAKGSECPASKFSITAINNQLNNFFISTLEDEENIFFSPLSISLSLGMLYLGARGSTEQQMKTILGFNKIEGNASSSTAVHQSFRTLIRNLSNRTSEYNLFLANGIFVQSGYELLPEFKLSLRRFYSAQAKSVDFATDGEKTMQRINHWVSIRTRTKIPKMFNTPLDPITALVIINAIYFKGTWEYPFSESFTSEALFYKIGGGNKTVPFMRHQKRYNYFYDSETGYTFLELNYKGDHISMLLALPNSHEFPTLQMTSECLCKIRSNLNKTEVAISIPKFKLQYEKDLSDVMTAMGLGDLFSETADLSGMRAENDIYVSFALHKAVIEVNEVGSEAAAVNAVVLIPRSRNDFRVFTADHPFLFYIIDKISETILFTGRVTDPQ